MQRPHIPRKKTPPPGWDLATLWQTQGDAIATFAFATSVALLALLLSPSQEQAEGLVPQDWFYFLEQSPGSPYPTQLDEDKEIKLDLPFEQVLETASGTAEADQPPSPWKSYTINRNDTLGAILHRITTDKDAITHLVTQKLNSYRKLRRGKDIEYQIDTSGNLVALRYKASPDLHLQFTQDAAGNMKASEGAPQLVATVEAKAALITSANNSLFAASDDAGVPDAVIQVVIDALETRIDFQRDTRLGDNFTVVYERLQDSDGDAAGNGKVFALRYINQGKAVTGLLNEDDGGYYEPDGASLQQAFLRSPLKFSRISSRYTLRRFHPVLKKWRSHRGVDFAAPTNTPVRASGDGRVEFVGRKGGYGNAVMIKHFGKYLTLYGHLNKFARNLKKGSKVRQGQLIGYVGSTGLATGPHLHYEFRENGNYRDPLSTAVPTRKPSLEGTALATFQKANQPRLAMLTAAGNAVDGVRLDAE